jgi:sec-independent protein translocase protein TatA
MFNVGFQEILIILLVALLLFGGRRLPELAKSLGNGLREFRSALGDIKRETLTTDTDAAPRKDVSPQATQRPPSPAPGPKPGEPAEEHPEPAPHNDSPKG